MQLPKALQEKRMLREGGGSATETRSNALLSTNTVFSLSSCSKDVRIARDVSFWNLISMSGFSPDVCTSMDN